jgi:hypothetical protein
MYLMFTAFTAIVYASKKSTSVPLQKLKSWYEWEYLPLLVSLIVTLLLRAWLITHTGGVLDGDEATVGVQAEHILHGERPVYFYGQAHMGSLEAYLIALLFAIFGPSVWALRAEPALLSLIIVWATWRFATILAEGARLKPHALRYFRTCSVFFAAITPLYDAVVEMKTLGGYIEIFIIMLLLLLCTLRLTQRWQTGVATRELLWRWMGIGALLGLSLWVNLLAISAITTIALWFTLFCLQRVIRWQFYGDASPHKATSLVARGLFSALGALPAACITAMPALLWGAANDWRNITTMSGRAGKASPDSIKMLSELYAGCVSNRVVGGALPGERQAIHFLHTLPHILGLISIAGVGALILLSFLRPHPLLLQARQLTLLPTIFAVSTVLFFLISWSYPPVHCFNRDIIGRYAAPLALVLPFFIATLCTLIYSFFHKYSRPTQDESISTTHVSMYPYALPQRFFSIGQFLLTALILSTLASQFCSYFLTNPGLTFQSPYCHDAPAHNEQIIAYMRQQHIHYAWATMWVSVPIVFKTNEQIIVAEPNPVIQYAELARNNNVALSNHAALVDYIRNSDRLSQYAVAVINADRPGLLAFAAHGDPRPPVLRILDSLHITYKTVIFPAEPGVDLLLITPLNHSITLSDWYHLKPIYYACPSRFGDDVQDV